MHHGYYKRSITAFATAALIASAHAGSIDSSTFNVDPSSTSIDTTGADVLDWGYFLPNADFLAGSQPGDVDFDALKADYNSSSDTFAIDPATNSKASPGIGIVTITERDVAEYTNGTDLAIYDFTVDDGLAPVSGTQTAFGAANGIAGGEDIFTITFNDIGAGITEFTLYMAHTNTGRTFSATTELLASDGDDSDAPLISPSIGGADGNGFFTYSATVTTTDANADLSIAIDSNNGGSGQFAFAGYTVVAVPEPTSLAWLGIGGLMLAARRRRRSV
jgi:hypothetical protein